ncbi:hypothetical protein [Vreelandella alkaliphila]|uniref:Uncharacterized protein n=1 Tax=Vreelandella alkaliphila TaxID=272774 RepID=A0AAJ2VVG9_9GAMM|nr:hypothetical protein [Halomonas alkaliphila]MDX5979615.1 hypothetical protein [Halomonas alkaliphila]
MNLHAVLTGCTVDDAALLAAIEASGVEAQAKHLQRAATVAAGIIAERPMKERFHARKTFNRWMDKALAEALAQRYRSDNPGHDDGVVLVWQDEAYGWKDKLRDPQSERPGVYAVDAKGNAWEAVDGNEYDGAERWEPM